MSVQKRKLAIENMRKAVQVHHAQHAKAGEMIELMKLIRADALRRERQYKRMIKAGEAGNFVEVKWLFAEMQKWRKYKIQ